MSTERRVRRYGGTAEAPAQEALSVDLLLEIVALADVATVIRCAGTGRTLRRAIVDPAFRRRLALAAEDSFDPALLLGVSYREHVENGKVTTSTDRFIHTPGPTKLPVRLDAESVRPDSFEPVASRDGLLVLRRREVLQEPPYLKVELRTRDTLTGNVTSLPPTTLPDAYFHVVLGVGGAGRSFELLVADKRRRFYGTFSSEDSQWSAVREVSIPQVRCDCESYCSAVIGRTVYWPLSVRAIQYWDHVLALDVDSGETTLMDLPPSCLSRMMNHKRSGHLLLAAVHGRLCLLVSESQGIAMWTLTSSGEAPMWSRQVVISSVEIARQAGLGPLGTHYLFTLVPVCFEGFGERSDAVILKWGSIRQFLFLRLDLGTKEKAPVVTRLSNLEIVVPFTRLFLHEIDLVSFAWRDEMLLDMHGVLPSLLYKVCVFYCYDLLDQRIVGVVKYSLEELCNLLYYHVMGEV